MLFNMSSVHICIYMNVSVYRYYNIYVPRKRKRQREGERERGGEREREREREIHICALWLVVFVTDCLCRPRSIVSAVPLGNRGHKARSLDDVQSPEVGIFFTSCFKIGPYASAVHPQDVLGGHADDISLLHHSHPHEVLQQRGQEELKGKTGEWAADGDIELTAFASDGSTVVQRSGSTVTVTWKGVPWLAMPFEYWIGVWLEVHWQS